MSVEYLGAERKYVFSYSELRADYERFCAMSDDEFIETLPQVLHFVCIVAYLKEMGISVLSDDGILHQLVHLLAIPNEPLVSLSAIRRQFAEVLRLAR